MSGEEPPAAANPFAASELIAATDKVREGETITYTLAVRYAGSSRQQITVTFPLPEPAMLVSVSPPMVYSEEYHRELTWEGEVTAGHDLLFTISLVTIPDSAGSRSLFAGAGIFWRPQGREWQADSHWLQNTTEIHSQFAPILYVLPNGMGIGKTELVLLGYLVLGTLLTFLIPALILRREKRQRADPPEPAGKKEPPEQKFLYALSFTFVFLLGMAHLLGSIVLDDIRRYVSYQKTSCTLLDKRIILEEGSSSSRGGGTTHQSTTTYNKPLVAVRYVAGGREIIAAGSPRPTAMLSPLDRYALRELARYERGKSYSCWYDPEAPQTFVLAQGVSWGWYLLGAIPMFFLYLLGGYFLRRIRK